MRKVFTESVQLSIARSDSSVCVIHGITFTAQVHFKPKSDQYREKEIYILRENINEALKCFDSKFYISPEFPYSPNFIELCRNIEIVPETELEFILNRVFLGVKAFIPKSLIRIEFKTPDGTLFIFSNL